MHGSDPQDPADAPLLTGEELLAMGDLGPCELVDGRIVPMSPAGMTHGAIVALVAARLTAFLHGRGLGKVAAGDVGIYTKRAPDRIRGADVAVVSRRRCPEGPGEGFLEVAPELVVEVVSPSDPWQDLREKVEEYFAVGVDRVWIVEPRNRAVVVCRSAHEMHRLGEEDLLLGEGVLEGLRLPVAEIFAE